MAGVAQVWLTHNELEAIAEAFDILESEGHTLNSWWTPTVIAARAKIESALAPVACDTASGPKTP